ncbi:sigma-70 family RNA polymerase sigma factor [bacterium]|nr:sigma-70 family RNA polymerase sigma factor [bacterium]
MSLDINSLLSSAQSGDSSAEKALIEHLSVRFRVVLHQEIRDEQDAQDILQDTLAAIAREYRSKTFERSFTGWAAQVLKNRMLDYYRTRQYRRNRTADIPAEDLPNPSSEPTAELKTRLRNCLHKICKSNLRYARILVMSYQGQDLEMICSRLTMSRGNVYTTLSRARSLLEYCLETGALNP